MSVREAVANALKKAAPVVEEEVITIMTQREVRKRADAVVSVLDQIARLENEQRKLKPDQNITDDAGKVLLAGYSKAALEELNKNKQRIKKLSEAVEKALTTGDFGDVLNLANSKDS